MWRLGCGATEFRILYPVVPFWIFGTLPPARSTPQKHYLIHTAGFSGGNHPPPYTNARLLSVGRFHLGFPQYTREKGALCVCHGVVTAGAHFGQFDSFLPSVLCKETPTLSPQHTHNIRRMFGRISVISGEILEIGRLVTFQVMALRFLLTRMMRFNLQKSVARRCELI